MLTFLSHFFNANLMAIVMIIIAVITAAANIAICSVWLPSATEGEIIAVGAAMEDDMVMQNH